MKYDRFIIIIFILLLFSCKSNKDKVESFLTNDDYMFWEAKEYDSSWERGYRLYYYFDKNGTFFYVKKDSENVYRLREMNDVFYHREYKIISDSVISIFGTALSWIEIDYKNNTFELYNCTKSSSKVFFKPSEDTLDELNKVKYNEGY